MPSKMKIEKLTAEQKARFQEFVDKWTAIGLCTEPANKKEAEVGIAEAYAAAGLAAPKRVVWCGSPLSQGLTRNVLFNLKPIEVNQSVGASVGASVRASVGASVVASVVASVEASVRESVWASVWQSAYGQHDANWLGFYDYFRQVCGLELETQKLCGMWRVAQNGGWWLPHEHLCWISERHNVLNRNALGQLHKNGGPALAYPDGWCIYALNGVRMSREYVETPAERIDPATVFAEKNSEIRRELIRKIGVERFLSKAPHKVLETKGSYQLLSVELSEEIKDARYLKMLNPSVGAWHVEAVHPTCNTVQESVNWRASQKTDQEWSPAVLT